MNNSNFKNYYEPPFMDYENNLYIVDKQSVDTYKISESVNTLNNVLLLTEKAILFLKNINTEIILSNANINSLYPNPYAISNIHLDFFRTINEIEYLKNDLTYFVDNLYETKNKLESLINTVKTISLIYESNERTIAKNIEYGIYPELYNNDEFYLLNKKIPKHISIQLFLNKPFLLQALDMKYLTTHTSEKIKNVLYGDSNSNGQESLWISNAVNTSATSLYPITSKLNHNEKLLNTNHKSDPLEHISLLLGTLLNKYYSTKYGEKNYIVIKPVNNPDSKNTIKEKEIKSIHKNKNITHKYMREILKSIPLTPSTFYENSVGKLTASNMINRIKTLPSRKDSGAFEIIKHERNVKGQKKYSWSILIRGTQRWDASSTNIQDQATNFNSIGKADNDQYRAIIEGMKMIGIKKNEPIEFVGHSQGGIIATQLATSKEINTNYNIVSLTTFGSPTGRYNIPNNIQAMHFENLSDPVTGLDGKLNPVTENRTTVYFNTADRNIINSTHDQTMYSFVSQNIEDNPKESIQKWVKARENFITNSNQNNGTFKSTSHIFDTIRL